MTLRLVPTKAKGIDVICYETRCDSSGEFVFSEIPAATSFALSVILRDCQNGIVYPALSVDSPAFGEEVEAELLSGTEVAPIELKASTSGFAVSETGKLRCFLSRREMRDYLWFELNEDESTHLTVPEGFYHVGVSIRQGELSELNQSLDPVDRDVLIGMIKPGAAIILGIVPNGTTKNDDLQRWTRELFQLRKQISSESIRGI
jgi:hypothetical protein